MAFQSNNKNKRKYDDSENSIIGYEHNLSGNRRNKANRMDYFAFTLLTAPQETRDALLYSPSKKTLLQQSQDTRTPVRLVNYAYTRDGDKIVVNDMTFVRTPQATEYAFKFSHLPEDNKEPVSILDIVNTHKEWVTMILKGKITQLKDSENVGSPRKRFQSAQAMFTVPTVSVGKSYEMTHVQLKVWSGKKKITTTKRTTITAIDDDELAEIQLKEVHECNTPTTAFINEVARVRHVETFFKCYRCQKRITQLGSSAVVSCSKCGMIKANKCEIAFLATVDFLNKEGEELTLKIERNI